MTWVKKDMEEILFLGKKAETGCARFVGKKGNHLVESVQT